MSERTKMTTQYVFIVVEPDGAARPFSERSFKPWIVRHLDGEDFALKPYSEEGGTVMEIATATIVIERTKAGDTVKLYHADNEDWAYTILWETVS